MGTISNVILDHLRLDPAIQAREGLSKRVIQEYATLYREGHPLPPIQVFQDGDEQWLADGFHRASAAREAGLSELTAEVTAGSRRDAMLYACTANTHGLPRTQADKRRVVRRLLDDPEWRQWSDRAIARHCGVAHTFVAEVRRSLESDSSEAGPRTYRTKHGTVATMQTRRIGRSPPAEAADTPEHVGVPEAPEHPQVGDNVLPASTAEADSLGHERGGEGTHEVRDPAVTARTDSPADVLDASGRPDTPMTQHVSMDHEPQHVLSLMEALCDALPLQVVTAELSIPHTWFPAFAERYSDVYAVLLERLIAWKDALQQADPASVSQAIVGDLDVHPDAPRHVIPETDVGEDDLATLPESPLAPDAGTIPDACGSVPHASRDLDACGWCGSDQLFRPVESGRVYCQHDGCRAVYNPSTDHWHRGERTKPVATGFPEPTPGMPPTLTLEADVDGLPPAPEVAPL
jgi:hypothetical protein